MDILMEWLGYLGRWGHVIAAITWIGTSFYFNWLDLSERTPKAKTLKPNVEGEVHEMHGGSFYYHERYWPTEDNARTLAHSGPAQLTFLTGLFLIFHTYWLGAEVYLVDAGQGALTPLNAILASAVILFLPWLIYNSLCKRIVSDSAILALMILLVTAVSLLTTQIFSPRAAFVHVGAMLGTIMAANVQYVIIPNHIRMRNQVKKGEPVDLTFHNLAKRRSQHNNYMTLPVVFSMISVHFPLASANNWAWLILVLVMGAAFTIRHYRNVYLATDKKNLFIAGLAALLLAAGVALSYVPAVSGQQDMAALDQYEAEVFDIVQTRCTVCHAANPAEEDFTSPPAGVRFETFAQIIARKDQIMTLAIASDMMPPGNWTEMTGDERTTLGIWLATVGAVSLTEED